MGGHGSFFINLYILLHFPISPYASETTTLTFSDRPTIISTRIQHLQSVGLHIWVDSSLYSLLCCVGRSRAPWKMAFVLLHRQVLGEGEKVGLTMQGSERKLTMLWLGDRDLEQHFLRVRCSLDLLFFLLLLLFFFFFFVFLLLRCFFFLLLLPSISSPPLFVYRTSFCHIFFFCIVSFTSSFDFSS